MSKKDLSKKLVKRTEELLRIQQGTIDQLNALSSKLVVRSKYADIAEFAGSLVSFVGGVGIMIFDPLYAGTSFVGNVSVALWLSGAATVFGSAIVRGVIEKDLVTKKQDTLDTHNTETQPVCSDLKSITQDFRNTTEISGSEHKLHISKAAPPSSGAFLRLGKVLWQMARKAPKIVSFIEFLERSFRIFQNLEKSRVGISSCEKDNQFIEKTEIATEGTHRIWARARLVGKVVTIVSILYDFVILVRIAKHICKGSPNKSANEMMKKARGFQDQITILNSHLAKFKNGETDRLLSYIEYEL